MINRHSIAIMLFLATVVMIATGCLKLLKDKQEDEVVAQVDDKRLMRSDVTGLYSGEDSLKLAETYVNGWILKQLKAREAESIMDKEGVDIDALVEDYRNSLLSQKLDRHYVEMSVDTTITVQDINEYYLAHKADFTLERPLVKGRIVRVPKSYRQTAKLKELMSSQSIDKRQDFADICVKNGFELEVFEDWIYFRDFLNYLPVVKGDDYDYLLSSRGIQTMSDIEYEYFVEISNAIPAGNSIPVNMVESEIRRIILNMRSKEIIRAKEDSLYNAALKDKTLTITGM